MLPLSMFIGIMVAVGQFSSDSEMIVMRASGYSTRTIMKICLIIATVTAGVNLVNNLWLMPYAEQRHSEIMDNAQNNPQYLPIEGGRFVTFSGYTLYLDSVAEAGSDDKRLSSCYVLANSYGVNRASFLVARAGRLSYDEQGVQWLNLTDATRYEGPLPDGTYRETFFEEVRLPLPANEELRSRDNTNTGSIPTSELWGSDNQRYKVELQWRICPLLGCFVLAMVAVPLSLINPRQGRFARLIPAVFIYVSFYMFMLSLRNLMNAGNLGTTPGLYLVPAVFLVAVVLPLNLRSDLRRAQKRLPFVPAPKDKSGSA